MRNVCCHCQCSGCGPRAQVGSYQACCWKRRYMTIWWLGLTNHARARADHMRNHGNEEFRTFWVSKARGSHNVNKTAMSHMRLILCLCYAPWQPSTYACACTHTHTHTHHVVNHSSLEGILVGAGPTHHLSDRLQSSRGHGEEGSLDPLNVVLRRHHPQGRPGHQGVLWGRGESI